MSRLASAVRGAGLTRSPLHRPTDRIEARATLALLALFLIFAPMLAWQAGDRAYRVGVSAERDQVGYTRVRAVLLEDAGAVVANVTAVPDSVLTEARWLSPTGAERTGRVPARSGAETGTSVFIWVDADGRRVLPPREHEQTIALTYTVTGLVPIGLLVLLVCARSLLRRVLDVHRMTQWQREWQLVEPRWSGRAR